jgi:ABC-2 type transport system ATP-binding protein
VAVFKQRLRVVDAPANLRRQVYGRRITVQLAQDAADFKDSLMAVKGVREVEIIDHTLAFNTENPELDNPKVIRRLVQAGANIQFVNEVRHTLEEVYLNLITEEAPSGGAVSKAEMSATPDG